ncbi:MAG: hypothetical protein K9I82_04150 [Chitinophagaceae bacterium]|jgi:uncharacterized protein YpuA (DUF1002 family)|nr:hypothetical protein [Chitinophagaceae bacterium]
MTKEEFLKIVELYKDITNKSNIEITEAMNNLTKAHFETKNTIIDFTYYLDSIEEMYNKILTEYNRRTKNE